MVYTHVIFFILGLILLVKGSDLFVTSSSKIAKKFGVSDFLIGLTLVAVGTSVPELVTSIVASIKGESDLVIGNVIGSNITNIGLILGISAFISTIVIKKTMLKRDAYIMISSALAFYLLAFNGTLGRAEGIFLLLIYTSFITFLMSSKNVRKVYEFEDFVNYFLKFEYLTTIRRHTLERFITKKKKMTLKEKKKFTAFKEGLIKDFLVVILSGAGIIYGAKFIVTESIWVAELLGVSTGIIGLSLVALGTSLPELGISLRASLKGYGDMVVGNIIGSNIANVLLILGITSVINPVVINVRTLFYTAPFMILISLILIYFMRTKWKLGKVEGAGLFILYLLFMISIYALFRN